MGACVCIHQVICEGVRLIRCTGRGVGIDQSFNMHRPVDQSLAVVGRYQSTGRLHGHQGPINCVALATNCQYLASGGM
jgi:hypothetical protein